MYVEMGVAAAQVWQGEMFRGFLVVGLGAAGEARGVVAGRCICEVVVAVATGWGVVCGGMVYGCMSVRRCDSHRGGTGRVGGEQCVSCVALQAAIC